MSQPRHVMPAGQRMLAAQLAWLAMGRTSASNLLQTGSSINQHSAMQRASHACSILAWHDLSPQLHAPEASLKQVPTTCHSRGTSCQLGSPYWLLS